MEPDPLQQVDRTWVRWNGRTYSYFGGCDYFRLSSHPKVTGAMRSGLRNFGLSVAASRLTTGNHAIFGELESALALFFGAPNATLVSSGFAAAPIAAQAWRGRFSRVLMDEKSHPSLQEASRQFRCPVEKFHHRDASHLERLLKRRRTHDKPIVLTDGLFAHSGEVPPLQQYLKALPKQGWIFVDDAHGAGTLGANGRGAPEFAEVSCDRIIQTLSLSKAFGAFGGAVLGPSALCECIFRSSSMFAGSTALPPPLAAAALASVNVLRTEPRLRLRLERNIQYVRAILTQKGFPISSVPTPIIAVNPASDREAVALRRRLLARKVYPSLIQYPGSPAGGYFRFAISSEHTRKQLDNLLESLSGTTHE